MHREADAAALLSPNPSGPSQGRRSNPRSCLFLLAPGSVKGISWLKAAQPASCFLNSHWELLGAMEVSRNPESGAKASPSSFHGCSWVPFIPFPAPQWDSISAPEAWERLSCSSAPSEPFISVGSGRHLGCPMGWGSSQDVLPVLWFCSHCLVSMPAGSCLLHLLPLVNPFCFLRLLVSWGERPALHSAARR